ncbi:hypothetical protein C8T65DRAFT_727889 [Cerioporus squamosus]|nr:hypothetical protein C8T65DRAFT_727889 [Cerioporus squamosus]
MSDSIAMNLDVIIAMMDSAMSMPEHFRPRSIITSMMLANRALYHEKVLLSASGNVTLRNSNHIPSFINFCLAENGSRISYLRTPLREFVYNMLNPYDNARLSFSDLARCAPTLEVLRLFDVKIHYGSGKRKPRLPPFGRISHLLLNISRLDVPSFGIHGYIHAFPNLKRLTATTSAHRSFVMRKERRIAGSPTLRPLFGRSSWASLTELRTNLATAWAFGLSCEVQQLRPEVHSEWDIAEMLSQVLADLRPATLYLEFDLVSVVTDTRVSVESPQLSLFLPKALKDHPPELAAVEVGLYLGFSRPIAEVENVLQGFAGLNVEYFRLIVLGRMGEHAAQEIYTGRTEMLIRLNPKEIAKRMPSVIPSLRKAAFELRGFPEYTARIDLDLDGRVASIGGSP